MLSRAAVTRPLPLVAPAGMVSFSLRGSILFDSSVFLVSHDDLGGYGKSERKRTLSEVEGIDNLANGARVGALRSVTEDNGGVVDALDVVLTDDDSLEGLTDLDLLGDLDTGDAGLSKGEESGGSGGDRETHVGGFVKC